MTQDQDPYGVLRLQPRARDVFARAARMQDLHAQAQVQALAAASGPAPLAAAGANDPPQQRLSQAAARAVVSAHDRLQAAAQQARQLALLDPVMAQLNARINGAGAAALATGQVLDMALQELPGAAAPADPPPLPRLAAPDAG